MLPTMSAHRPQIIHVEPIARRASLAAEVAFVGGKDKSKSAIRSRKVSFAPEVEIIPRSVYGRKVSFAREVDIIPPSKCGLKVSFAEDVEIIGTSDVLPGSDEDATMQCVADAAFDADYTFTQHSWLAGLDVIPEVETQDNEAILNMTVTEADDLDPLLDHGAGHSGYLQQNPPRTSSLLWRHFLRSTESSGNIRTRENGLLAPPSHDQSLFWHGNPRTLALHAQSNPARASRLLSPLATNLPPQIILPATVTGEQTQRPRSPPPAYTDHEVRAENLDDEELIAAMNPAPNYWQDPSPPAYRFEEEREYDENFEDFIVVDWLEHVEGWWGGIRAEVVDAWTALRWDLTGR